MLEHDHRHTRVDAGTGDPVQRRAVPEDPAHAIEPRVVLARPGEHLVGDVERQQRRGPAGEHPGDPADPAADLQHGVECWAVARGAARYRTWVL
jgi:hypothetical protein